MKIVYIPQLGNEEPWYTDFATALGDRFPHVVLDPDAPLGPQFEGARVVVDQGGHGTRAMIDAGAEAGVELWQAVTTGLDHSEVDYVLEKGIRLSNTPGLFSAVALAEHVLFLMLFVAKKFRESEENLRAGVMYRPLNDELEGNTLGLVGLGASGRELARRATVLGMRVIAIDAYPAAADELAALGVERCDEPQELDLLLRESDYVSIHIPLTATTRHLINAEKLELMKPSGVLINVARGGIVDEGGACRCARGRPVAGRRHRRVLAGAARRRQSTPSARQRRRHAPRRWDDVRDLETAWRGMRREHHADRRRSGAALRGSRVSVSLARGISGMSELDSLLEGDAYYQDPYPAFARLREEDPVHWHAASRSWLVARWQETEALLRAPRAFSSYGFQNAYFERLRPELRAAATTLELRGRTPTLITSDPPEHTRLRRLLQPGFSPKAIDGLRPRVDAIVDELLAEVDGLPAFDLVATLAYPLPAMMIADILGVPRNDRDIFKRVASDVVRFMNRANPNQELTLEFARYADDSLAVFRTYLRGLIDERRRQPRDDMVSILVHSEIEGEMLDEEELLANLVLFLIAGHETTTGLIASAVYLLLSNSEQRDLVVEDRARLSGFVREALRVESPVQRLRRVVRDDVELGGVLLPAGEPVEVLVGSANRDAAHYDRPDDFDLGRPPAPSLAFGKGAHFCIGESLALLEADVALSALIDRYPGLALASGWQPQWSHLTNLRTLSTVSVVTDAD